MLLKPCCWRNVLSTCMADRAIHHEVILIQVARCFQNSGAVRALQTVDQWRIPTAPPQAWGEQVPLWRRRAPQARVPFPEPVAADSPAGTSDIRFTPTAPCGAFDWNRFQIALLVGTVLIRLTHNSGAVPGPLADAR